MRGLRLSTVRTSAYSSRLPSLGRRPGKRSEPPAGRPVGGAGPDATDCLLLAPQCAGAVPTFEALVAVGADTYRLPVLDPGVRLAPQRVPARVTNARSCRRAPSHDEYDDRGDE